MVSSSKSGYQCKTVPADFQRERPRNVCITVWWWYLLVNFCYVKYQHPFYKINQVDKEFPEVLLCISEYVVRSWLLFLSAFKKFVAKLKWMVKNWQHDLDKIVSTKKDKRNFKTKSERKPAWHGLFTTKKWTKYLLWSYEDVM